MATKTNRLMVKKNGVPSDFDSDIDIVAKNGKKTHGGVSSWTSHNRTLKVEYGSRVSDEFCTLQKKRYA